MVEVFTPIVSEKTHICPPETILFHPHRRTTQHLPKQALRFIINSRLQVDQMGAGDPLHISPFIEANVDRSGCFGPG